MCSSPRLTDWGQTYQQNMFSSPRFTGWEVKPTIGTCISLYASRVERSNLPSGHAFFSTLYGLRAQTYHQDMRSSPRFTGWELKPTIRTCVLLHALRFERSNLPSGHTFFSTLYGWRGQTYHEDKRFSHALRVERSSLPSGLAFFSTLYGLGSNLPSEHAFLSTLHGLRSNLPSEHAFLSTLYGLKSNLPSEHVFFSTLDGLRSNLPSEHVFFSTLYGLRGQTYHQDMHSSPRFTGWEVKPTIRTSVLLHALWVERSYLPWGQAFFSTLYGLRGQT